MAVAKYYTADDLLKRRVDIGIWIASQTDKLVANLKYGQLVNEKSLMRYQYVVACHVALMGYTPITTAAQDGVDNGLTEANVDDMIDNIEIITGLHFLNKETTYNTTNWTNNAYQVATLNSGGSSINLNKTPTAQELIDHPHLGTGFLQLFATV
tara:strand:- start:922 stop:1383 length:462 start_codon:yes stop_codon:yes gene_type:complete